MAANVITENISKLAKLPALQSRAAASILGAVVADAAARPLHWVYDRDDFKLISSPPTGVLISYKYL